MFLFRFVCTLMIIGSFAGTSFASSDSSKTNVILIVVDDLGWKDVGFMGSEYYETPNLDAFARQGMVFTKAYASAANCAPSRACMLSGHQSPRHGVYTVGSSERGDVRLRKIIPIKNVSHLSDETFTMADMFRSTGYVTGSFGKWHIGDDPTAQGIDVNVGGSGRGNPGKGGYFAPYKIDNIEDGPRGEYLTDRLTDEAIQFMEYNSGRPFFLYLPYYNVHTPIMAKEDLVEKFKNKGGSHGQSNPKYAAMVHSIDQNIGRLLEKLAALELEDNTLVVFTSDNGGIRAISQSQPLRAGKGSYYEGGIRVPLVVRWPDHITAGTTCEVRVTNLDFYPTFQEIVGPTQSAQELDGVDISPLLFGKEIPDRDLFWHFPIYLEAYDRKLDDGRDPLFRTRPGTVLISNDWKLHQYFEDQTVELYDLSRDVGERNDLSKSEPEIVASMLNKMMNWRDETNAPIPTKVNRQYDAVFEKMLIDMARR